MSVTTIQAGCIGRMLPILMVAALTGSSLALAQSSTYRFGRGENPLQDRDAYLLTLIEDDAEFRKALSDQAELQIIGERLATSRNAVLAACGTTSVCPVEQLILTDAEIDKAGDIMGGMAGTGGTFHGLVQEQMRPSGRFQKYSRLDDAGLMRAAWVETARGVNRLYRVYALAQRPRYPAIDAMAYDPTDAHFRSMLESALEANIDGARPTNVFFAPWAQLGFDLLVINQRDEAARYEPLEQGANAASFARAHALDWRAQRFTAILVPGIGLAEGQTGLSPEGASAWPRGAGGRAWHR